MTATTSFVRPAQQWGLHLPASRDTLAGLMAEYGVSAPVAQMLHARGLGRAALQPELRLTPNSGLREAARRVVSAIHAHKRIRIHGDYDADGVSATATLVWGLRELGANVHGFIPHRLNEGYGIHPSRVDEHAEAADLLVTVDCGVSNHAEVQSLLDKGLEVIVTDHHSPGETFPSTLVVHPHLTADYDHNLHNLTGAGVAYHLLWAVRLELGLAETEAEPRHLSPLATLGTVADVAPLIGENRALVAAGLPEFARTALPGVRALMGERQSVSARDVAFQLAPRINAAGRMGEAEAALELLTTNSAQRARELATFLEIKNKERRVIQDQMFEEALSIADPTTPALVITAPHWHAGVMGIVASKLLEHYYKPVYIVAQGKGSVRSTPGISAVGGLRYSAELLQRFGGHPGAAGFAMPEHNFAALQHKIYEYAQQFPAPVPTVELDALVAPSQITAQMYAELTTFEPYGEGWRPAQWHLRADLQVPKLIGQQVPKSTLAFGLPGVRAVQFGQRQVPQGPQDIAAALDLNEYGGNTSVQLRVNALRPVSPVTLLGAAELAARSPLPKRLAVQEVRAYVAAKGPQTLSVYATGKARAWWQSNFPHITLLDDTALDNTVVGNTVLDDTVIDNTVPASTEVLLCALPPEHLLRHWLSQTPAPQLTFAWGQPTLSELQAGALSDLTGYWRWQWAQLYQVLDDQGFGLAVYALLGLPFAVVSAAQPSEQAPQSGAAD